MAQGLLCNVFRHLKLVPESSSILQVRYAARKGTRERRAKKKVKHEVKKAEFVPQNVLKMQQALLTRKSRKYDDTPKPPIPPDNVYVMKFYRWRDYPFEEAVLAHRESNHPEMYGNPSAQLRVQIELNTQAEKKTRFIDNFTRTADAPYKYDDGDERAVLAFSKSPEDVEKAIAAGATLAGGTEIIHGVQNGSVNLLEFRYVVANPNILPELSALRGLLKRKFPSAVLGTLSADVAKAVRRFKDGIVYTAEKDPHEKDFGIVDVALGTIDMDPKHLEANFVAVLEDVISMRPKREGIFIRRCLLVSPPSKEKLKVDHLQYLKDEKERLEKEAENKKELEEDDMKESVVQ